MSIVIPSRTSVRQYAQVLRHFAATRGVEVCVLQASPLLGAYLGGLGLGLEGDSVSRLGFLLLGSTALTGHVFVFNDWAGYSSDARDLRRPSLRADGYSISRDQIARVAIALLILANVAFAAVGTSAMLFGAGIATLSLLYSFSPSLGKSMPIAASVNHLIGGGLHFLLGYTMLRAVDARGLALSLFFGLVFAAGHLNQEVRDYEFDLASGIGTSAVAFGCRRGFLASFCLFTAAYLLIVGLAALGAVPKILLLAAIAWLMQAGWSLQALRRGLGFETAMWMQRRYRLLFALVGLAMLVR
jgi:4-hydroxybenzoate polyprenyltransferase